MSPPTARGDYTLQYAKDVPKEAERLDDMHDGIKEFFGGNFSRAPVDDNPPQKILEVGSGSGVWAIEAAEQFPDAEVLAVDLSPIPPRTLPPNLKFRTLDLTKPFPLEPESFDVVHARFIFIHLPDFKDIFRRIIKLVKPGGWLLIDDIENYDRGHGPSTKRFWHSIHTHMRSRGADPYAPSSFEGLIKESGVFSEINIKKVLVPISKDHPELEGNQLGPCFRVSFLRSCEILADKPESIGTTPDVGQDALAEMSDPTRDLFVNLYFTWSRRSL